MPKRGREKRGVEEDLEDFLGGPINLVSSLMRKDKRGTKGGRRGGS